MNKMCCAMEIQVIKNKIYEIRGFNVMLDFDLAELYGIETKRLKEAVRRNLNRFPEDFMFELTNVEANLLIDNSRSQFATLNNAGNSRGRNLKYMPFAFTEQGVAMLASVLNSPKAIDVNIQIVRAFVVLRKYVSEYAELKAALDHFMQETNLQFEEIYEALTALASKNEGLDNSRLPIGYLRT